MSNAINYEINEEIKNEVYVAPAEEDRYLVPEEPAAYEQSEPAYEEGIPVEALVGTVIVAGAIGAVIANKDKIKGFFGGLKQKRLDKLAKKLANHGYEIYGPETCAIDAEYEEIPEEEEADCEADSE